MLGGHCFNSLACAACAEEALARGRLFGVFDSAILPTFFFCLVYMAVSCPGHLSGCTLTQDKRLVADSDRRYIFLALLSVARLLRLT